MPESFAVGGLPRESFARPGKLFMASAEIVARVAGTLTPEAHRRVVQAVLDVIQSGVK
jgi:hypothetical protein